MVCITMFCVSNTRVRVVCQLALKIKREPAGPVVRCVDRGRPGQGHPETGLIQLNTPTPQSVYIKRFLRVTSFRLQDPHPVSVKGSLKKRRKALRPSSFFLAHHVRKRMTFIPKFKHLPYSLNFIFSWFSITKPKMLKNFYAISNLISLMNVILVKMSSN